MGSGHRSMDSRKPHSCDEELVTEPVDIDILIRDMQRLQTLVKPFVRAWHILYRIRRWDSPQLCVLILAIINGACFIFPTSYYLLLQLVVIGSCATVGVSHIKYRLLSKVLPNPYIPRNDKARTHAELMHDFRMFLGSANTILKKTNDSFIRFYSLLKWEDTTSSRKFYLCLSLVIFLLNVLPLRSCITLLLDFILLEVPIRDYVETKYEERMQQQKAKLEKRASESAISRASFAVTPMSDDTDTKSLSQLSVSEAGDALEDSDLDMSEKFESGSSGSDFSDNEDLPESGDLGGVKVKDTGSRSSGMMSRIIEFKKRQQQAGTGACIGCGVNFSSILKRRRTCTYCGNHYCSKCCCHKIPKTYFGATAPAAQMETVLVCHYCHQFLTAGSGGGGGPGPTDKAKPHS